MCDNVYGVNRLSQAPLKSSEWIWNHQSRLQYRFKNIMSCKTFLRSSSTLKAITTSLDPKHKSGDEKII